MISDYECSTLVKGQHSFKVITNRAHWHDGTQHSLRIYHWKRQRGNNYYKQILFCVHWWCSKLNIFDRATLNPAPVYYLWRWKYSEWNLSYESAGCIEDHSQHWSHDTASTSCWCRSTNIQCHGQLNKISYLRTLRPRHTSWYFNFRIREII